MLGLLHGRGVPLYHSRDLVNWERGPAGFQPTPEWIAKVLPENRKPPYWAPDIIRVGDRYLLYCSVSMIGKMTSAIGLATHPTLDPDELAYQWTDQGIVVQTGEGQAGDAYNALDPALFQDTDFIMLARCTEAVRLPGWCADRLAVTQEIQQPMADSAEDGGVQPVPYDLAFDLGSGIVISVGRVLRQIGIPWK